MNEVRRVLRFGVVDVLHAIANAELRHKPHQYAGDAGGLKA
jgi:hypothetical protein